MLTIITCESVGFSLQEAKQSLIHKQEDVARLREENARMEDEIVDLGDSHKSVYPHNRFLVPVSLTYHSCTLD